MRKIDIPQEAIDRHNKTLGKALIGYLEQLATGNCVSWDVVKKERKRRDHVVSDAVTRECVTFWDWVHKQFQSKRILTATPVALLAFAKEYLVRYKQLPKRKQKAVFTVVQKLFDYPSFREGKVLAPVDANTRKVRWVTVPDTPPAKRKKTYCTNKAIRDAWDGWSLAEFVRMLDVRHCPYCNAETVGVMERENPEANRNATYSAVDHVLPKDKYPLLALSLYNLVPACYRCNSQFKGGKDAFDVAHWDVGKPFNGLHPYAHHVHQWFRFRYRPTDVAHLFLKPYDKASPLAIMRQIPVPKASRSETDDFYDNRTKRHLLGYELQNSYRDLYATEINEILKTEIVCTPTFIAAMKKNYGRYGLSDNDFDLVFRRIALDPREINRHRFAKLIIDLHRQIGTDDATSAICGPDRETAGGGNGAGEAQDAEAAQKARRRVIEQRLLTKRTSAATKMS